MGINFIGFMRISFKLKCFFYATPLVGDNKDKNSLAFYKYFSLFLFTLNYIRRILIGCQYYLSEDGE